MGLGLNPEADWDAELDRLDDEEAIKSRNANVNRGPTFAVPPAPPAKETVTSPRTPPPPQKPAPSPPPGIVTRRGTGSMELSEPPNRPLPAPPRTSKTHSPRPSMSSATSDAPRRPPPIVTRPTPPFRPQAPLRMNPPTRPGTAGTSRPTGSTKRQSWSSVASSRRPIKYGQGKFRNVELVPQPSDDPDDPLNWPRWRKELNFYSVLLVVSMTGVMKTIFMSVNAQLAEGYNVSYTSAAALTGVPLIISAVTGFGCLVASRVVGKRPLYLGSLLSVFIGAVWNTNVSTSYAQCMAARVFQGLGWGAFDSLVLGSIQDTFYEHERGLRVAIYSVVSVATTWGPPLIGGVASETQVGFGLQFTILSSFFVIAVPAIALGAPETVFDRAYTLAATPATSSTTATSKFKASMSFMPRHGMLSLDTLYNYAVKMKPYTYHYNDKERNTNFATLLLQAPRAMIAPTTLLLFIVSFLPYCALWGLSSSLSLLFNPLPFDRSPREIGILLTGPWLLSTAAVAVFSFGLLPWWRQAHGLSGMGGNWMRSTNGRLSWLRNQWNNISIKNFTFTPKVHMAAIAAGSLCVFVGVLTFGLHIDSSVTVKTEHIITTAEEAASAPSTTESIPSIYALDFLGDRVNFPALSFVLGLLALGAHLLDSATVRPLIKASTSFTSSNLGVALRNTTDMNASVSILRTLMAGIFVIATPNVIWTPFSEGQLRGYCIGVSIAQMVVAASVGTVWWLWGGSNDAIRRWDGKVMKLVNLGDATGATGIVLNPDASGQGPFGMRGRNGSFFDTD